MHEEFLKRNADIWTHGRNTDGDLFDSEHLPKSWDWREIGGLSKVWEQGACGGCWAFTTVAAVEGVHYIWTKEEVSLSPQMLLECDPIDQDCTGGNMVTGYQYAVMKGGISSANDYPCTPTRSRRMSDRVERTRRASTRRRSTITSSWRIHGAS